MNKTLAFSGMRVLVPQNRETSTTRILRYHSGQITRLDSQCRRPCTNRFFLRLLWQTPRASHYVPHRNGGAICHNSTQREQLESTHDKANQMPNRHTSENPYLLKKKKMPALPKNSGQLATHSERELRQYVNVRKKENTGTFRMNTTH